MNVRDTRQQTSCGSIDIALKGSMQAETISSGNGRMTASHKTLSERSDHHRLGCSIEAPDVSQWRLPVRESQSPINPLPTPPMIPPMGMMAANMGA